MGGKRFRIINHANANGSGIMNATVNPKFVLMSTRRIFSLNKRLRYAPLARHRCARVSGGAAPYEYEYYLITGTRTVYTPVEGTRTVCTVFAPGAPPPWTYLRYPR